MERWDSCGKGGKKKDYYLRGRPIKSSLQKPRTLLSSQLVPFREFQE